MAHGGKRNGAGRKPSSATKKTRVVADKIATDGITPLEVMIDAMRKHYDGEEWDAAAAIAKDAAPYVHPKLSAVDFKGTVTSRHELDLSKLTDDQLATLAAIVALADPGGDRGGAVPALPG